MLKVTDDELMQAVFLLTLRQLPARNIQRYVGARASLIHPRYDGLFRTTKLLASNRAGLNVNLKPAHLLIRLRELVDRQHIHSDEKRHLAEPGRTFYYWLPDALMRPVIERCRAILTDCGFPACGRPVLMNDTDALADSVARQLGEEFTLVRYETGTGTSWKLGGPHAASVA